MVVGLTKGDKAAEAGKIGDQFEKHFCIGPTSLNREVYYSTLIYYTLKELYSQLNEDQGIPCVDKERLKKEVIDYCVLPQLTRFKEIIDKDIEKDPSFASSAIVKFCCSIVEDNKLRKELEELSISAKNSGIKIIIDFQLENLKEKMWFLKELKEKSNFAAIQKAYRDKWSFYDLINDKDFKQTYIDKAVTESAGKSFKEGIDKFIELAEQGKKAASKHFERKGVELRAYYTETDNTHRVLNVNLINYNRSEPTRISDILQQEKDIKELNIYCNKKHEIHAHQEDKRRYYEFKEGAYYEMTSTWPVKDEFGNVSICTMIMNVSSSGITEVLKFDGKDFVLSEEIQELIKRNDELYIQGLSLYDAVIKSLAKGKAADVIPTANNNFQNESITVYQDKEPEGKLDPKVDADNSLPPPPPPPPSGTQTEVASQHIATQTEINSQQIEIQTEVASQQMDELDNVNVIPEKKKLRRFSSVDSGLGDEHYVPKEESDQRPVEIEQGQKNTELQTELAKKDEELAELREKVQELESMRGKEKLRQELEVVNEELKSELKKLKKELHQVQEGKSDLEDKFDQLERFNKEMNGNQKQLSEQVLDLQEKLSRSKEVIQALSNKLKSAEAEKKEVNQKHAETKQRSEALEKQISDLQDKLEKKERESKAEIDEICKELTQLKDTLEEKEEEFKSVYEEKGKLEDKLKVANAEKKELEDKLKEFEKEIDQAAHIMKEKEQFISDLKRQMLGLENKLESYKQKIDELKEYVDGLEEKHDALSDIIADKVLDIKGLTKEIEDLCNQVEMSSAETVAYKQKGFNNQYYTLTGEISNEPDNAPQQKSNLSRFSSVDKEVHALQKKGKSLRSSSFNSGFGNKSYVPLEEKTPLLRSLSIDGGYDSDEENCDNNLSSNISPISSIEKVAKSRNVGSSPRPC